jgi:2-dehydropantoate 2-reductase
VAAPVKVVVAGAGTIGSLFAAHLARVADVGLLVRREEHATALNEHGLRVSGRSDFTADVTASTDPEDLGDADLVVVACKTVDLESVARRVAGHFAGATVMTVQNGLGAEEILGAHGTWPLLSGVTFISGTRHGDAHVEYVLDTSTWIGPYRNTTAGDARRVAEVIVSSGMKAEAFDDLRPAQWSKLIFNASVNPTAALIGLPHDSRFAEGELGELVHALMDEGKAVAAAAGVELGEDPWKMNLFATRHGHRHRPSMLEDVSAQRPTEIELITGSLVREAERHGVAVPLHRAIYALVKGKEASYLT